MATSSRDVGERPLALRLLLASGAVGPLLFIVVFLVEGATRPDYNPLRHFVSSLSLGDRGWVQIASFVICGTLVTCFAVGLRRALVAGRGATWGPILLAIFGLGLVGAGVFPTDPLLGYPPGAPTATTAHGALHMLFSLFVFACLAAACLVLSRRFAGDRAWRGWAAYSFVTGILVAALFVATDVVSLSPDPSAPAGLVQRVTIVLGWIWVALLALKLTRDRPPLSR
jgi:hypothetical membrane protein